MKQRKQYIVDKKFQLKTTFSVIGIVFIVIAIVIGAIGVNITMNNTRLSHVVEIQDNIVQALTAYSQSYEGTSQKIAIKNISNDHFANLNTIRGIIKTNNTLLIILIAFILLQGFVLYIVLIRKTHKIAGPIYVMRNYMQDIINGTLPDPRPLRKNDELKDFYNHFKQMVDELKKREQK